MIPFTVDETQCTEPVTRALRDAALQAYGALTDLTTEQFARGEDKGARDALRRALALAGVQFKDR